MFFNFRGFLVSDTTIYSYKIQREMKNRLQFNRIPTLFTSGETMVSGTTIGVSGRDKANSALTEYITRRDFIPLIGEPIVVRYIDDKGKKQLILAVGKATGQTANDTYGIEYHRIDTAKLTEDVDLANENASEALELASEAMHEVENYRIILRNMIGESGVELEDGSFFDTDDPSNCGLYKPIENSNYLDDAVSFRDADKKLDQALGNTDEKLTELSGATEELSGTTKEYFENIIAAAGLNDGTPGAYPGHDETHYIKDATSLDNADVLLDAAIHDLSGNTMAALEETNQNLEELSGATVSLEEGLNDLSAGTVSALDELDERVDDLEGREIFGQDAIIAEADENEDYTISLKLYENEKVLSQSNQGLRSTIKLVYVPSDKKIYLNGIDDVEISHIDTDDFVKDGMLDSANIIVATEEDHEAHPELVVGETYIKLVFNTDAEQGGKQTPVFISAKDLVDEYKVSATSINYLTIEGYEIRANVDVEHGLASYDALTDEIERLDNTDEFLSGITRNIISGTGLNILEPGAYGGHDETHYIKDAVNLDDADVKLDEALWALSGVVADLGNTGELEDKLNQLSGVTREFSATTDTLIRELSARTVDLGEVYQALSAVSGDIVTYVDEVEEMTAAALNELNDRVGIVETHMTGEYIPLSNYEISTGETYEDLLVNEGDTVNEAVGKLQKQIIDDEEVTAAALNDLNDRVTSVEGGGAQTAEDLEALSASVVTNVQNIEINAQNITTNAENINIVSSMTLELSASVINNEENINIVSSMTMEVSGLTDGTLTVFVNGVQQGVYSPSADTEFWLSAITRVTGKDVILEDYVMSSATTEEDLLIKDTDTVNDAFGKIQKQALDNEAVISTALNELNRRLNGITAETGGDVSALSASVVTNKANIAALSAATTAISQNLNYLSAVTLTGVSVTMDGSSVPVTVANHVASFSLTSGTENYFDGAVYDSSDKKIYFKHGNTVKAEIDATDFIKDGMVSSVTVDNGNLVISFNTEAGREDIELALTSIFDPDNYYNKDVINAYSAQTKEYIDAISGLTDAKLTLVNKSFNYGTYDPSGNDEQTIDLDLHGDEMDLQGYTPYVPSYDLPENYDETQLVSEDDTVNEAFEKLQKQTMDLDYALASSNNDLLERINNISGDVDDLLGVKVAGANAIKVNDANLDVDATTNKTISLAIDEDDKVLTQSTGALLAELSLEYDSDNAELNLVGKDNEVISTIDTTNFPGGGGSTVYTGGDGINIDQNDEISVKLSQDNEGEFLKLDSNGLYISGLTSMKDNALKGMSAYTDVRNLSAVTVSAITMNGDVYLPVNNVIDLGAVGGTISTGVTGNGNVVTELLVDQNDSSKVIYNLGLSATTVSQYLDLSADTTAAIEKLSGDIITEIIKDELAAAAAFNDLNVKVAGLSAGTIQLSADTVAYINYMITGSGQFNPALYYDKNDINTGVSASTELISGITEILSGGLYTLSGYVANIQTGGSGVSDVKVNGTSVVTNNVAEITAITAETPVTVNKSGSNTGNVIGTISVDSTNKHKINYTVVSAATAAQLKSLSAGTMQLSADTVNYINLVSGNIETVINSKSLTYTTAGTGNVLASLGVNGHQITGNLFSAASADQLLKLSATTVRHETDLYALSAGVIDNEYVIQQTFNSLQGSLTGLSAATTALSSYTYTVLEPKVRKHFVTTNATTLDITKQLTVMTLTGSQATPTITITDSFEALDSLNLETDEFTEVHVIIENNSNTDKTIDFDLDDDNATLVCTTGNSMFILAHDYGEVNALITYDGSNYVIYIITT